MMRSVLLQLVHTLAQAQFFTQLPTAAIVFRAFTLGRNRRWARGVG